MESATKLGVELGGWSRSRRLESAEAIGAARNSNGLGRLHLSWSAPSVVAGCNGLGRLHLSWSAPSVVAGSICRGRLHLSWSAPSVVVGSNRLGRLHPSWSAPSVVAGSKGGADAPSLVLIAAEGVQPRQSFPAPVPMRIWLERVRRSRRKRCRRTPWSQAQRRGWPPCPSGGR